MGLVGLGASTMKRSIISKPTRLIFYLRILFKIIRTSFGITHNVKLIAQTLLRITNPKNRDPFLGIHSSVYKVGGKFYWNLYTPGYPSAAYNRIVHPWMAYHLGIRPALGLCTGFIAITRKCALSCEHCFEWESLNQPETLSDEDILVLVDRLRLLGACQIFFTGGEPVNRFDTIIRVLNDFRDSGIEFWIITSAIGLNESRIMRLKEAGLTGITFSLDHHDEQMHDRFRGRVGCYRRVLSCIDSANDAQLVTAVSLCATNSFVTEENIDAYVRLASSLEIQFIQILEPQPVGHYAGKQVMLTREKQILLEELFNKSIQSTAVSNGIPVISYPGFQKRVHGCMGGDLYVYSDCNGRISPCPFCQNNPVSIEELDAGILSSKLKCPHCDNYSVCP